MSLRTSHFGKYSVLMYTLCYATSDKLLPHTDLHIFDHDIIMQHPNYITFMSVHIFRHASVIAAPSAKNAI